MTPIDSSRPLISVRRLRVYRQRGGLLRRRRTAKAIDDVHFDLRAGETLAIVGEAGSGKSSLAGALLGTLAATGGSIAFAGQERVGQHPRAQRSAASSLRGVMQSPLAVFGRRMRVERLLGDALKAVLPKLPAGTRRERVTALLARLELPAETATRRLGDLEPAVRARVMLAQALAVDPQLLIVDGPADGLDADARRELLDAVARIQQETGFALILTAREFEDVAPFARRVLVLSLGRIMEQGPVETVIGQPAHPYSRRLLALSSGLEIDERTEEGELLSSRETPSAENPPMGCVFHTRCGLVERSCVQSVPLLKRTTGADHYAACHFAPVP